MVELRGTIDAKRHDHESSWRTLGSGTASIQQCVDRRVRPSMRSNSSRTPKFSQETQSGRLAQNEWRVVARCISLPPHQLRALDEIIRCPTRSVMAVSSRRVMVMAMAIVEERDSWLHFQGILPGHIQNRDDRSRLCHLQYSAACKSARTGLCASCKVLS